MTPGGQVIAFASASSTFVPETQEFFANDVFVRDMRPQADLAVTMTDSPDPVTARGQVTYTVTIRNDGPGPATGVTLTDTLPDAAFVSSTQPCAHEGKGKTGGVLTSGLGSLAPGESTTVNVVVSPSRAGTIANTATVRANEPDADAADNATTESTTVLPRLEPVPGATTPDRRFAGGARKPLPLRLKARTGGYSSHPLSRSVQVQWSDNAIRSETLVSLERLDRRFGLGAELTVHFQRAEAEGVQDVLQPHHTRAGARLGAPAEDLNVDLDRDCSVAHVSRLSWARSLARRVPPGRRPRSLPG